MNLLKLALSCLKVGAFVFGGGPVIIPLLEDDIVNRFGWLTPDEFTDAVALGQMTPGPLLVTATFVGYKLGIDDGGVGLGLLYATVATACIFIPSFFMVVAASHQLGKLKANTRFQAAIKGISAGIVGLILAVAVKMGREALEVWPQFVIGIGALVALMRFNLDTGVTVVSAGILGLLASLAGLMEIT